MEIYGVKLREDKIKIINNPVADYDKDLKKGVSPRRLDGNNKVFVIVGKNIRCYDTCLE